MANAGDNPIPKETSNDTMFQCNLCPKTFHSCKALHGHQNVHRSQRSAKPKRKVSQVGESSLQTQQSHLHRQNYGLGYNRPNPNMYGLICTDPPQTHLPANIVAAARVPYQPFGLASSSHGAQVQHFSYSGGLSQAPKVVDSSSTFRSETEIETLDLTLKL